MFGSLFDEAVSIIEEWKPKQNYPNENQYRDDLMRYLRQKLNDSNMMNIGFRGKFKIVSEAGRHLCDIAINDSIGIELKLDLRKLAEVDRLYGQIGRYSGQYDGLIIVLVGRTSEEIIDDLRDRISKINSGSLPGLTDSVDIELIVKKSQKQRDDRDDYDDDKKDAGTGMLGRLNRFMEDL
jgi:hypothetical protein